MIDVMGNIGKYSFLGGCFVSILRKESRQFMTVDDRAESFQIDGLGKHVKF